MRHFHWISAKSFLENLTSMTSEPLHIHCISLCFRNTHPLFQRAGHTRSPGMSRWAFLKSESWNKTTQVCLAHRSRSRKPIILVSAQGTMDIWSFCLSIDTHHIHSKDYKVVYSWVFLSYKQSKSKRKSLGICGPPGVSVDRHNGWPYRSTVLNRKLQ